MEHIGILTVGELTNPGLMMFTRVLYPCNVAMWVQETRVLGAIEQFVFKACCLNCLCLGVMGPIYSLALYFHECVTNMHFGSDEPLSLSP